jgi:hypothetical protein
LKLNELLEGGDDKKEERQKKKLARQKMKATMKSSSSTMMGPSLMDDDDDWGWGGQSSGGKMGSYRSRWHKEYINKYTITMDIKLLDEIPRDGISLFQTALIHAKEDKRSGKATLSRSDGECMINQAGGVGMFGTYGDTTKARVERNLWRRVVVSISCTESQNEKGEMRTWVGTEAGVVLKEDTIVANERFALDPDGLFLFSSAQAAMMPGNIAIRTVRIQQVFSTDRDVKANRARDKV